MPTTLLLAPLIIRVSYGPAMSGTKAGRICSTNTVTVFVKHIVCLATSLSREDITSKPCSTKVFLCILLPILDKDT